MTGPLLGINIGGTTTSVSIADPAGRPVRLGVMATRGPRETIDWIAETLRAELGGDAPPPRMGISCGDPMDWRAGMILGPPNLPGWDRVAIVAELEERLGGRAWLMNDANAGALAEWTAGAGRGCQTMIFLTAGTGMGAGLILDGRLYEGVTGSAGEAGHLRLTMDGPVGYGKAGSFEGWCSGGGIAQVARQWADRHGGLSFYAGPAHELTARHVGEAAMAGDRDAVAIMELVGDRLGAALAILVDLLNPERIILGSIYARCEKVLAPAMQRRLSAEALPRPLAACTVLPAALGESIGDHAALAVARYREQQEGSDEPQ
jgi:glucokinase